MPNSKPCAGNWKRRTRAWSSKPTAACCYALSDKYWVTDPQGVAWETFHTLGQCAGVWRGHAHGCHAERVLYARWQPLESQERAVCVLPALDGQHARLVLTRRAAHERAGPTTCCSSARATLPAAIMAEVMMNHLGGEALHGLFGGQSPQGHRPSVGHCDPAEHAAYPWTGCAVRVGRNVHNPDAPTLDFVFTVCDDAASEVCPVWPGTPMTAHWGVEDPAALQGSEEEQAPEVSPGGADAAAAH